MNLNTASHSSFQSQSALKIQPTGSMVQKLTSSDDREEGAFASIGHPDDSHISHQLQFQLQP